MNGEELDTILRSMAEPKYADFSRKMTPGCGELLGVRVPKLRAIAKDICKEDWREFLTYPSRSFEHTMIRAMVIATAKMDVDERLALTEKFVPEVRNWAVNDCLCCSWKLGKREDHEKVWKFCVDLLDRHEEFPSRIGAVMMMSLFIDEEHIDEMLDRLVSEPRCGYYLDMGVSWALSFCYIKFPEKTEKAIFDGRMEYTVLSMTVRKIRDSFRVGEESKERLKMRLKEARK